jgi:ribosomal protein L11 methyltransferase
MEYIKISIQEIDQEHSAIFIALLSEAGYEGFEETEGGLLAYIDSEKFDKEELDLLSESQGFKYQKEIIQQQNWNALWESNFEPVIVDDFCTVRAHFHELKVTTPFDIVITPKMSFGTGHHSTTVLMMQQMRTMDFKGKKVIDFGAGTGILSILAEKLGAENVIAIDNDEWATENSLENVARNGCTRISVRTGSLESVSFKVADIILANINRHILLEYMELMYRILVIGGYLLLSGLLVDDREIIVEAANKAGFRLIRKTETTGWIALLFDKKLTN